MIIADEAKVMRRRLKKRVGIKGRTPKAVPTVNANPGTRAHLQEYQRRQESLIERRNSIETSE